MPHGKLALAYVAALCLSTAAQADVCTGLRQQLAALDASQRGAPGQRQAVLQNLHEAKRHAHALNCRPGFLFFGGTGGPECGRILGTIRHLESQLRAVERSGYGSYSANRLQFDRQAILRDMQRFNCPAPSPNGAGGYETVCVRHCDGYFFQIGFKTDRSRFKQDAALCAAHYPDAKASLYVRPSGADATELASVDGAPYAEQSFAFRYQQTYDPSCARPAKIVSPKEIDELQKVADQHGLASQYVPVPRPKPSASDLAFDTVTGTARGMSPAPDGAQREIRVIGPVSHYLLPADYGDANQASASVEAPVSEEAEDNADAAAISSPAESDAAQSVPHDARASLLQGTFPAN